MKILKTLPRLSPAGRVAAIYTTCVIGLGIAVCTLSGCDVTPFDELAVAAADEASDEADAEEGCSADLHAIVEAHADKLRCHSECADLFLACLAEEVPACWACEHEAAVCRSTCPDPALWGVL